ncbi:hypothetical protein [Archaeoglobus sp.]
MSRRDKEMEVGRKGEDFKEPYKVCVEKGHKVILEPTLGGIAIRC